MKKIFLISIMILIASIVSCQAVDIYASLGIDGSWNMGFQTGMIFTARVFTPVNSDYLSYSATWISSADKINLNSGREFNVREILFRKIKDNLYLGAGESYVIVDTNLWTKKQFNTLGAALWYPQPDIRIMFTYSHENSNAISGVKLEASYVYQQKFTIEVWGGFNRYSQGLYSYSGYTYGSAVGFLLW